MKRHPFETVALQCLDSLLGYARHLARNEDEAEDLVQEAYSRVLAYRDKVRHPDEARPLLFRILHNLFIDQYRHHKRGPVMISVDELQGRTPPTYERLVDPSTPLSLLLKNALSDEMQCALRSLDEGLRETLCLRELEGFSYEEISEILEIPVGTVRSRLSRARREMARRLVSILSGAPPAQRDERVAAAPPGNGGGV